jgi:predicted nucleotidyltransferase
LLRNLSRALTADERAALDRAWRDARQIAEQLVNEFGARRVILFGSVARQRALRPNSDIDLLVDGMPLDNFYRLVGDLRSSEGRAIDLIRLENVGESFRKIIELEGVVLAYDGD